MIEKWRHLIEPVMQDGLTPIPWDKLKELPCVLFEGDQTVLYCMESQIKNVKSLQIVVAAGKMNEVDRLFEQAKHYAKQHNFKTITYMGRQGWLRTHGFKIGAVVGIMEV